MADDSLTSSALLVAAIQATNLPVLLLAVPAGVLGDLLDRKKLILAGQLVMLLAAAALGFSMRRAQSRRRWCSSSSAKSGSGRG